VGRLALETTERKLRREFEEFGPVASVVVVPDRSTDDGLLSAGYGFVEFATEDALKLAYRRGDGKLIDGRRVVVDVERGRTVPNWLPRRLGGGLGDSRRAQPPRRGKKDGWGRPPVPRVAGILTLDIKRKQAAATQAAIDASTAAAAGGAGAGRAGAFDARAAAAAPRAGYCAAFDAAYFSECKALAAAAREAPAAAASEEMAATGDDDAPAPASGSSAAL
jgi:hypothetical protein